MINANQIALIAPVEANKKNLNNQLKITPFTRLYEDEAVKCFQEWRKNGGWLKDIHIYVVCPTENEPSSETLDMLRDLNVTYIHAFDEQTKNFSSGFLTLPWIGRFFENDFIVPEEVLIRIDLDMKLVKALPKELIELALDAPVIGQYDAESIKDQRTSFPEALPFDTGLMVVSKNQKFCSYWYDLCFSDDVLKSSDWKRVHAQLGDYYLEEFVIDYIVHNKLKKVHPIQKYQHGEGYASVDTFTNDQLKSLYFLHEHIYVDKKFPWGYNSVAEQMKYLKRVKSR